MAAAEAGESLPPPRDGRKTDPVPKQPLTPAERIRRRGNWLNGSTALGLLIASAGRARIRRGPAGLYLAERLRWRVSRAGAFTVGNVVITPSTVAHLTRQHPDVMAHEDAHAWQYFWALGLPFLPLYAASAAWSWLRTGDPASANPFERQAGLARGGYVERPATNEGWKRITRPVRRPGQRPD